LKFTGEKLQHLGIDQCIVRNSGADNNVIHYWNG